MYTIIVCVGNMNDIGRYDFWLRDFENAGFGKVLSCLSLEGNSVVNAMLKTVRGRDKWSMIILHAQVDVNELKNFLEKVNGAVAGERNYLLHMPHKVWLLAGETKKDGKASGIDMTQLPPYCRLLEYVADSQQEDGWAENLKRICIAILFAINEIYSENFVVYYLHKVDVEIDIQQLWQYIQEYREVLYQGVMQAEAASAFIVEQVVERDREVLEDRPTAISEEENFLQYKDKWLNERQMREKAYFDMKSSVSRHKKYLHGEVKKREHFLQVVERELSPEDEEIILEKSRQEEVEILRLLTDMRHAEQELETRRVRAERKSSSAQLLRWGGEESMRRLVAAFLGTIGVGIFTLVEVEVFSIIDVSVVTWIVGIAIIFTGLLGLFLLGYNCVKCGISNSFLKVVSGEIRNFEKMSKENNYRFALLCCRMRRRQTKFWGHRLAIRNKNKKIEMARKHNTFCQERLEKIGEWEFFWRGIIRAVSKNGEDTEAITLNIFRNPEKEMAYNVFHAFGMQEIPINSGGKMIQCPFPFVKKLVVERVFGVQEDN